MVGEITERQLNEFLGHPKKAQRTGKPPLKNRRKQHVSTTKEILRLGLFIKGDSQKIAQQCICTVYKQNV